MPELPPAQHSRWGRAECVQARVRFACYPPTDRATTTHPASHAPSLSFFQVLLMFLWVHCLCVRGRAGARRRGLTDFRCAYQQGPPFSHGCATESLIFLRHRLPQSRPDFANCLCPPCRTGNAEWYRLATRYPWSLDAPPCRSLFSHCCSFTPLRHCNTCNTCAATSCKLSPSSFLDKSDSSVVALGPHGAHCASCSASANKSHVS